MRRMRRAKIVATLGPASHEEKMIEELAKAGADVFRINMSHASHDVLRQTVERIRNVEKRLNHPLGILVDLQGPKLRVWKFAGGSVNLVAGQKFTLDSHNDDQGNAERVYLPHPEIIESVSVGDRLLLDDGKLALKATKVGGGAIETEVIYGGKLSDKKGVSLPDTLLPTGALTEKDHADLLAGLAADADWIALSFVQRPEDIEEARAIIGKRAWIMAKLEKPAAIDHLDAIVDLCDGVMVARGDLGVELPPERVPELQRLIVRACRKRGKPVVVATQMLESMIAAPVPTRAEVSDVATAVYDGVDAVMLSAESASGKYPLEAVAMMDRIISRVEADASYRIGIDATHEASLSTTADAVCASMRQVAALLAPAATVTYTSSGFTSLRAARERPAVPIISLTPDVATARRMAMVWGVHAVLVDDVHDVAEMIECACRNACTEGFASSGTDVVVVAGLPFGLSGTTNLLHVARIP